LSTVKITVPDKIFAALGQEERNPENRGKSTVNKVCQTIYVQGGSDISGTISMLHHHVKK
jgi:hypothetical protein